MRAVVLNAEGALVIEERQTPEPGPGQALLRIDAAALNHRDLWITQGLYPGVTPPVILGSDGVGEVVAVGLDVDRQWLGKRVVVNPSCEWGDSQRHQGPDFHILGSPHPGTWAEALAVPVSWLAEAPSHLSDYEAAALPLAGLTAFRALFSRAQVQPGERVLITGIGGGVAQMALAFARSHGCRVVVTSSSSEKRDQALAAGAEEAFDYRDGNWVKACKAAIGAVDVVIDGSGGPDFPALVQLADFGARIVVYGATAGEPSGLPLRPLFWKQIAIMGTTMGSADDFAAMLALVTRYHIRPALDQVFPLAQAAQALQRMEDGAQLGKLVLAMGDA